MSKTIILMIIVAVTISATAYGNEVLCIPRAEMGETIDGGHLYERDDDLKISNLSRIDFEKLTITSAEGKQSKIAKVEKNIYKTAGSGTPYYFITNDTNSIVTEFSIKESATYIKILLCKSGK